MVKSERKYPHNNISVAKRQLEIRHSSIDKKNTASHGQHCSFIQPTSIPKDEAKLPKMFNRSNGRIAISQTGTIRAATLSRDGRLISCAFSAHQPTGVLGWYRTWNFVHSANTPHFTEFEPVVVLMSESDGLQKLTAYLNQTRRQAEAAVDALNLQIEDLRRENDLYAQLCKKLEQEKDYFKNLADQLKQGGTTKQTLQERDDWRALIDSVQKDRARLQEECCALETALDAANEEISQLRNEVECLHAQYAPSGSPEGSPSRSQASTPSRGQRSSLTIQCEEDGESSGIPTPLISPILGRNGEEIEINLNAPPQQVIRQLQIELKRAYAQVRIICGTVID